MTLVALKLRATVDKEGTRLTAEGAAYDTQLVRVRNGFFEKLYGWQKLTSEEYIGTCRALHMWAANSGTQLISAGTHRKFYVAQGGDLNDVTPLRATVTLGTDPIATEDGTTTITVTHVAHGVVSGAYATVSGVPGAINGVPADELNAEHELTVVDADSYTFTVTTAATATGSGGGGSVVVAYQINPGLDSAVPNTGWGAPPYGGEYFGTATDVGWGDAASIVSSVAQLRLWSQDNFGEDLIFAPRGGSPYYYDFSSGVATRGVLLSSLSGALEVPTLVNQLLVSEVDRHVLAYGCNEEGGSTLNRMLVRWSSQTTLTKPSGYVDWQTRTDNTAGGQQLDHGSEIIRAIRTRQETLIFTNTALYSQVFVGPPSTFRFTLLQESVALLAPNAVAVTPVGVVWMSPQNFYIYDGTVRPLASTVRGHVFSDINRVQSYKALVGHNRAFNEVWFFYASASSDEIDRYVVWNYMNDAWVNGTLERTAWLDTNLSTTFPTAAKAPFLYNHEQGNDDDGSAMTSYIVTGDTDYQDGDQFTLLTRALLDVQFSGTNAAAVVKFTARDSTGATSRDSAEFSITDTSQDISPRLRGRRLAMTITSTGLGTHWRLGHPRVDIQPDGQN